MGLAFLECAGLELAIGGLGICPSLTKLRVWSNEPVRDHEYSHLLCDGYCPPYDNYTFTSTKDQ